MSVTSSQDQSKIAELEATNRKLSAMLVEKDIIIEQLQQMISRNENNTPRPIGSGGGNRSLKSLEVDQKYFGMIFKIVRDQKVKKMKITKSSGDDLEIVPVN